MNNFYYIFIDGDIWGIYRGVPPEDLSPLSVILAIGTAEFLRAFPIRLYSLDFIKQYLVRHEGFIPERCIVASGDNSTFVVYFLRLKGGDENVF